MNISPYRMLLAQRIAAAQVRLFDDMRELEDGVEADDIEDAPEMPPTEAPWEACGDEVPYL